MSNELREILEQIKQQDKQLAGMIDVIIEAR